MKKTIFAILIIVFNIGRVSAQNESDNIYGNVVPPSPTSFEFTKYGQIPVGKFTGTTNVTIPIYNLKGRELTHSVFLSYGSNGIKVDQVSSWVGMGWNLVAGGSITRVVRDEDDDKGTRISLDDLSILDKAEWADYLVNNSSHDTEPDLYSYSFDGHSGKFVFDASNHPRLIPYENIHISKDDDGSGTGNDMFIITTSDGIKYHFGTDDNSREKTLNQTTYYVTAWHLTKIQHPSGEEINFTYVPGIISYHTGVSQRITEVPQGTIAACSGSAAMEQYDLKPNLVTTIFSKYLNEISTDNMEVEFVTSSYRPDLGSSSTTPKNLIKIIIREKDSSIDLKEYTLTKEFSDNTGYQPIYYGNLSTYGVTTRMFLASVTESANSVSLPAHDFEYYNMDALPVRLSLAQDHWGYFNGSATYYNSFVPIPSEVASYFSIYTSANREPNGNFAIYGLLQQVDYPTGGNAMFEYEPNTYWNGSTNAVSGGMRIKRITSSTSDNDPNPIIKRYYYGDMSDLTRSSAITPDVPEYLSNSYQEFDCGFIPKAYTLSSNSNSSLYNIGGNHIAYASVIESSGEDFENGGEYFIYHASKDAHGLIQSYGGYTNVMIHGATFTNSGWNAGMLKEQGFIRKASDGSFITLKKTENKYNYGDTSVDERNSIEIVAAVTRKLYDPIIGVGGYTHTCSSADIVDRYQYGWYCDAEHELFDDRHHIAVSPFWPGWKCIRLNANNIPIYFEHPCYECTLNHVINYPANIDHYDVMTYSIYSRWGYLKETTSTEYDEDGLNGVFQTVNYEYTDHGMLKKKIVTNSNGDEIVVENFYPEDYNLDALNGDIEIMIDDGFTGIPLDTRKTINGDLISGNLTKYNDKGQPTEIWKEEDNLGIPSSPINVANPYSYGTRKSIIEYDVNNVLSEIQPEDDIATSFIWGYNNNLPIAKATNAESYEIFHTSFEDDNGTTSTSSRTGEKINILSGSYVIDKDLEPGDYNVTYYWRADELSGWELQKEQKTYSGTSLTTTKTTGQIDEIKVLPADAQMTTYTYDPLIGLTSETDPNGQTTSYEYDDFGRLWQIKDSDGNILQEYTYNYANQ